MDIKNTNISFLTKKDVELSTLLQKDLFGLGYRWKHHGEKRAVFATDARYILANADKKITYSDMRHQSHLEVDPIGFLTRNLVTRPMDWTGCDPLVKLCLRNDLAVSFHDGEFSVGYDGDSKHYLSERRNTENTAQPLTYKRIRYKSLGELVAIVDKKCEWDFHHNAWKIGGGSLNYYTIAVLRKYAGNVYTGQSVSGFPTPKEWLEEPEEWLEEAE